MDIVTERVLLSASATKYSGTPLIRTPRGQAKLSVLTGCPYKRGLRKKVTDTRFLDAKTKENVFTPT